MNVPKVAQEGPGVFDSYLFSNVVIIYIFSQMSSWKKKKSVSRTGSAVEKLFGKVKDWGDEAVEIDSYRTTI